MKKSLILIFLSALTLSSCGSSPAVSVHTYKYQEQELSDVFFLDGTIAPADKPALVETELTGCRVKEVFVSEGDHVNEGDTICMLDTSDISEQIEELEKTIAAGNDSKKAAISQAEKNLEYAKNDLENEKKKLQNQIDSASRSKDDLSEQINDLKSKRDEASSCADTLYDQINSASDADEIYSCTQEYNAQLALAEQYSRQIDEYEKSLASADSRIESLELELDMKIKECQHNIDTAQAEFDNKSRETPDSSEKKLEQLKAKLSEAEVTAPSDGIIASINITAGQYCESSTVASIRSDDLAVCISVPDKYILLIEEGDTVSFKTSALNNKEYYGTVSEINEIRNNNGYDVYVSYDSNDDIRCGMTANVTFTADTLRCFCVPESALINSIEGNTSLYIAEKYQNGEYIVNEKNVETGISNGSYIQIISDSINEGDLIITDTNDCHPGMKVTPEEEGEK